MANRFQKFNPDGGNIGLWADPEHEILRLGLGTCTAYLYNDAGALKLATGRIGLDDGSQEGAVIIDTVATISLVGLTASCWARVEVSRTFTTPVIEITSIGGATNPAALPASFTGAYDGNKQGYYVSATKRVAGLAWINAGGNLEGIVNCLHGYAYAGYSTSDDAYDIIYYHLKEKQDFILNDDVSIATQTGVFTAGITAKINHELVTTAAASFAANIPARATWKGRRIRIEKVDTGAGVVTVTPAGAETFGSTGATFFLLRKQGDFVDLLSTGTGILVLASLSTLDSAALAANTIQTLAHGIGVKPRKKPFSFICGTADAGFSIGDEVDLIPNYYDGVNVRRYHLDTDATNFTFHTGAAVLSVHHKSTNAVTALTMASWFIRIRYEI